MNFIRSRGIIVKDGKVAVMEREKNGRKFCAFPGGHVEKGETPEDCVVRELEEEFGIQTAPVKLIYAYESDGEYQAFFVLKWLSGKIGKTNAEEYQPDRNSGTYNPTMIPISEIKTKNLVPPEIADQLEKDLKTYGEKLDREFILIKAENEAKTSPKNNNPVL